MKAGDAMLTISGMVLNFFKQVIKWIRKTTKSLYPNHWFDVLIDGFEIDMKEIV